MKATLTRFSANKGINRKDQSFRTVRFVLKNDVFCSPSMHLFNPKYRTSKKITFLFEHLKSSFPKRYKSILIVFMKMTFFYLDPYIVNIQFILLKWSVGSV